ncbi:MAG: DMT family transporter [candidate division KSB1 bacterium]|nr:DMT family transporter [candidate division KSB1 bacterium]MDZ7334344.1 DMT family transporter [candidate division KSB1 bacterium]MDZ7356385.1 DMT family transporter [candidate division KSB1 bacterium]MDZ7399307.1 DMT family transporter [candidate division KSB1 bacterium]
MGKGYRWQAVSVLGMGLIAISFASIFIKLCSAPSLVIAAYRLTIASAVYIIFTRIRYGPILSRFSKVQRLWALASGSFLALHFATWITSLKFTTVASSVVLVQSAPVFVAIGSILFLREKPTKLTLLGIVIAFGGTFLISAHDFSSDRSSLVGNLLAIAGAIGAAGYLLLGRKLRTEIATFQYVTIVYSVAAFWLLLFVGFSGSQLVGYDNQTYLLFIAIALIPQVIGHTTVNWALKYFSATAVAVIILGEPIGASILAVLILKEKISGMKILGGLIILTGVILALLGESQQRTNAAQSELNHK